MEINTGWSEEDERGSQYQSQRYRVTYVTTMQKVDGTVGSRLIGKIQTSLRLREDSVIAEPMSVRTE